MKVYAYITDNGDGSSSTFVTASLHELLRAVNESWKGEDRIENGEAPFTTYEDADEWCQDESYERGSVDCIDVNDRFIVPDMKFSGGYQ